MEYIGIVQSGQFELPVYQSELRKNFLSKLKDGTRVKETLSKVGKPKTKEQLGAIFGQALKQIEIELSDRGWDTSIIMKLPQPTGVEITKDILLQYFYSLFPVFDDNHKQVTLSKMDTGMAAKFYDQIRNFAASQWQIVILEPDKNWRKK